uniref:Uncharacterized protein n=1 Tax=Arundo donax TaxID=35708 RepID=A0A0A9FNX6_ARUDO
MSSAILDTLWWYSCSAFLSILSDLTR